MRIEEFDDYMTRNMQSIPDAVILPTAQELVSDIRNRVITKGISANKNLFSAYTVQYLKKRRDVKTHKNFYDTGKMWESFGMKEREDQPGVTIVKCYMNNDNRSKGKKIVTNQDLVEIHSDFESIEIIAPTEEEEKKMSAIANKRLEALWA